MLRVLDHGNKNRILNPVTRRWQEVVNVRFVEVGDRSGGANHQMSDTSDVLSQAVGRKVGLDLIRIHTHPVLADAIGEFPVEKEFPTLFINRKMFSTPQMSQQVGIDARMVEGRPTYFTTYIATRELPDEDLRLSNDVLAQMSPEEFKKSIVGATVVETVEQLTNTNAAAEQTVNTSRLNTANQ